MLHYRRRWAFWARALDPETIKVFKKKAGNWSTGCKGASDQGWTPRGLKCQGGEFEPEFFMLASFDKCARTTLLIYIFLIRILRNKNSQERKDLRKWATESSF